jgi:hypothetical protein
LSYPELQLLKQRAIEASKYSDRSFTREDAEYARALIMKSFFLSGYKQDMIKKALQ